MNCGWVKMYRKFSEWEWYKTPNMAHLFIHLVISANHEKTKWQGVDIFPGQFVTGLHSLSAATGITIQTLRTCLRRLEVGGEISRKSTNKFTIITICKYNDYQTEKKSANKQLTSNQQTTNNKQEVKNERIKPYVQKAHDDESQTALNGKAFSAFWEEYPKKRDKAKAEKAWLKIKPDEELARKIIQAVSVQKKTRSWQKDNGQFIPLPTTWLNGRRWEDEINEPEASEWQ